MYCEVFVVDPHKYYNYGKPDREILTLKSLLSLYYAYLTVPPILN